jgi:DNA mismatch repair protein MSH4
MTHEDISKTMMKKGFRRQLKRKQRPKGSLDLKGKVAYAGGEGGFGLELDSSDEENQASTNNNNTSDQNDGVYGNRKSAAASVNTMRRARIFDKRPPSSRAASTKGKGKSSQASVASSKNPYGRLKRSSGLASRAGSTVRSRANPPLPTAAVHIICAIGENLARETCIASLDAGTPVSLQVTKQGNGQTYAETLAYLEILRPDEVLLNEGRRNSHLARKVLQLYGGDRGPLPQDDRSKNDSQNEDASVTGPCKTSTVVKFIPRSCFDQTKGAELLRRVARDETYDASVVEEYILLSSAHAVLHYTQQSLGATFSRNCLDLTINSGGNNRMVIDRSTLLQLELLTNAKTGKTRNSLIATIDCTKTTVGSRLLRTNLMAPPCRLDTINARLDLVDTFLADEEFFYTVLEHLQKLPDVDKMLTNVAIVPRKARSEKTGAGEAPVVTERMASKGISALVCIKSTLTALPAFAMSLHDQLSQIESEEGNANTTGHADVVSATTDRSSLLIGLGGGPPSTKAPQRHHLLRAIIHAMRQPALSEIVEAVSEIFTESTSFSRNANAMRHQECFALKSADGMMDILRKAFLANVDDIYKKADEYAETHGIHVSVRYSSSRGYYLSVPGETASTLPQEFIQPAKSGNCIHCTTEEVQSLNTRAQDNVQDLLLMTYEKIREVLDVARSKYDALASLSDAVALLDLCHSFADNVTLSKLPWCRPVVSGGADESLQSQNSDSDDSGKIAIRNGRYGIDLTDAGLASADGPGEVIPNDTYATNAKNFTVISGINGSGKSTYLKQVAIIVLLAHCGSYVPAEQASIPVSLDCI